MPIDCGPFCSDLPKVESGCLYASKALPGPELRWSEEDDPALDPGLTGLPTEESLSSLE